MTAAHSAKGWWIGLAVFGGLAAVMSFVAIFSDFFPPVMVSVTWMFATYFAFRAGYQKRQLDEQPPAIEVPESMRSTSA